MDIPEEDRKNLGVNGTSEKKKNIEEQEKNIPEDNELVCMLLIEVHELNKKQVKTSLGHFNFLETIFGHKGDGELNGK